jgi:hypothetical protein
MIQDATAPTHLAECLWCYRFYRRGLEVDGWRLTGASADSPVASQSQNCARCGNSRRLRIQMHRHGELPTEAMERLRLSVCRECGHIELLGL